MKITLADPYLKTTRAHAHLDALKAELQAFADSKPYRISRKDDIEKQTHIMHIEMDEVPAVVPLIVGDFLYCLRSALDQTVWCLAKLTTADPGHTQFPIHEIDDAKSRKLFRKNTVGVPAKAVEIIKSLQPYYGGNLADVKSHLLWRLNALCNIDKHRRIPTHGTELMVHDILPYPVAGVCYDAVHRGCVVSIPLAYKSQMNLNPKVSFEVIFGDLSKGIGCNFRGLDSIYEFVAHNAIPRFTGFFH